MKKLKHYLESSSDINLELIYTNMSMNKAELLFIFGWSCSLPQ